MGQAEQWTLIFGAGGLGVEVADIWRRARLSGTGEQLLFIDDFKAGSGCVTDVKVVSLTQAASDYAGHSFVIALGEPADRARLWGQLKQLGLVPRGSLADPGSIVSNHATVGAGTIISQFTTVAARAVVGENVSLNVASIVGHDVTVEDHCVISSMVNLGGASTIRTGSYVGMGAIIKEKITIGANSIIGMGAVVHTDIPDGVIAVGNPARVVRRNDNQKVFRN